jgi:hypothetical protein
MNIDAPNLLRSKIFAICPICKKPIQGKDLELNRLENAEHWPTSLTCYHCSERPIKLWIDARYSVRDVEIGIK